ncbi:unnamed protein product [Mytilus coruscus]|uniref:Uncharacterized protein n=1 Tax=Mytilus coruscus TaxID=42192 RepID=A0A6J8E609_MYTCO|nr:unnamed protein product [Mytilus coruscus]
MRSEDSDAYVEEATSSVLEDNTMASDKVTSAPGKKESRLMARIEEQDKQFDSMNAKMGKFFDLRQDKLTDTGNEVPRSEHENQNTVTVEAFSAARRPLIPLNSAIIEHQNSGDDFEHYLAEGSEDSRNSDHEDVNTCDSRSVLVKSGEHDRFQKYLGNRNEKSCETEKQDKSVSHTIADKFGLDAYTSLKTEKTGLVLEQNQIDVLRGSWRSETPHKITSYKENYRQSFPVDASCQEYFNVPTMDNTVETDSPNLDSAIQNVRDIFALSTKSLDQTARTGALHHMIRRRATMYDTGLNELRDYANTIVTLPLTADGIFGSQFDTKMKEKTDRNKQLAEVLPDTRRVTLCSQLGKKKPTAIVT